MPNSMLPQVVIDANAAIGVLLPSLSPFDALQLFVEWRQTGVSILAPPLWLAECTSVIHRYVHFDLLKAHEGVTALNDLAGLEVTIPPDTPARCRAAYDWATQFGQARAYDGFYLALAQEMAAPLYTGDRRLANRAQQLNVNWIIWVGDA